MVSRAAADTNDIFYWSEQYEADADMALEMLGER